MLKEGKSKRAQISLFIIIAIIIVASAMLAYFLTKPKAPKLPEDIKNIEESYLTCLEQLVFLAKNLGMQKGGYIYEKESSVGGIYFSNNLEFMGENIPYWLYYNANGIIEEQVPTISSIEKEISTYVKENALFCDEILKGYGIDFDRKINRIEVSIKDGEIEFNALIDLNIKKENSTYTIREHRGKIKSNLKKLYENAKAIYDFEKATRFLENYTFDVISLYAPTTGFELQCMPLTFNKEQIKEDIKNGLLVNIERIKFRGNYFSLANEENKYYINDLKIDDGINVNFIIPSRQIKVDVYSDEQNGLIKFDPVGNQPGINQIGFCYVPYHLVYDVKYPLLILLNEKDEIFKFPLAVLIERNGIKEILHEKELIKAGIICNNAITEAIVYTYNQDDEPLEADVYFKCLDATCYIGKTEDGYLEAKVPECINGFIIARADGYAEDKMQVDSNYEFVANFFLNKLHETEIKIDLRDDENAVVFFEGENSYALNYPE